MKIRKAQWLVYMTVLVAMVYGGLQLEFLGKSVAINAHAQVETEGGGACCTFTDECGDPDVWMCTADPGETCNSENTKRCKKRPKP